MSPNTEFENFLRIAELWPINLSYKKGIDAFKVFLHETPGEGNLMLWLKIEISKHVEQYEKKRYICNYIVLRSMKVDHPHISDELNKMENTLILVWYHSET